jgi:glutamate-1-semialdehyde 2,1-aminomutase
LAIQEMAKRGSHGYASFYLNAAQGISELEQANSAARETLIILRRAIDSGNAESFLKCPRQQDAFRRLVR